MSNLRQQTSKQATIESYLTRPKPQLKRDLEIMQALARFVARDICPIALIEGEGFANFVRTLEPVRI